MTKRQVSGFLIMLGSVVGLFINVFFVFPLVASLVILQQSGEKGGKR